MKHTLSVGIAVLVVFTFSLSTLWAGDLRFKGVGGRLGYVKPEGFDGTVSFGGHANLGEFVEHLVLYPSIEIWSKRGFDQIALNGDVRYYFPPPSDSNIEFFAGGGVGILLNSPGDNDVGLNLLGGIDVPVSEQWVATGEARFVFNNQTVFKITAGITYIIGN